MPISIKPTFELDERFSPDMIKHISDDILLEIIKDKYSTDQNKEYNSEYFLNDPKCGINKVLKNYDKRLTNSYGDEVFQYELLKLKRLLIEYKYSQKDYNIFHVINRTSYRSIGDSLGKYDAPQDKIIEELKTKLKKGLESQSKSINIDIFINNIIYAQDDFINKTNMLSFAAIGLINGIKTPELLHEYCKCVKSSINKSVSRAERFAENNPYDYTPFEKFYQVVDFKQCIGGSLSQQAIAKEMLRIADFNFTPIPSEILTEFDTKFKYEYIEYDYIGDYLDNNYAKIAYLAFAGSDKNIDYWIKHLKKNKEKIIKYFYFMCDETRISERIELIMLVALCRSMFLPEDVGNKEKQPILNLKFNDPGYFYSNEQRKKSIYINPCRKNAQKTRRYEARLLLGINNTYVNIYRNSLDKCKKKLELEIESYKAQMVILNKYDYRVLKFFMDICYNELLEAILSKDILLSAFADDSFMEIYGNNDLILDEFVFNLRTLLLYKYYEPDRVMFLGLGKELCKYPQNTINPYGFLSLHSLCIICDFLDEAIEFVKSKFDTIPYKDFRANVHSKGAC